MARAAFAMRSSWKNAPAAKYVAATSGTGRPVRSATDTMSGAAASAGRRAGLIADPHREGRPAAVDHRVGKLRRDDLAPQTVPLEGVGVTLDQLFGEIARQLAPEIRIVRHARIEQIRIERELGVGEQDGKLGPCQALTTLAPFTDLHVVGEVFHAAIEQSAPFKRLHQPLLEAEILQAAPLRQR